MTEVFRKLQPSLFMKVSRVMKKITCLVAVLFMFFSLVKPADATIFRFWQLAPTPQTSTKKEDLFPGYKFTGDTIAHSKKDGDRLFLPNTKYDKKSPSFMLIDDADKWLSIKSLLVNSKTKKNPVIEKIDMNYDIVLIVFGGKRNEAYRQMIGNLYLIEKKDDGEKSVVMEVRVDDKFKKSESDSFGFSSAAIVVLKRDSLPKGLEASKERFFPLFRREKQTKENGKVVHTSIFGSLLKTSD